MKNLPVKGIGGCITGKLSVFGLDYFKNVCSAVLYMNVAEPVSLQTTPIKTHILGRTRLTASLNTLNKSPLLLRAIIFIFHRFPHPVLGEEHD